MSGGSYDYFFAKSVGDCFPMRVCEEIKSRLYTLNHLAAAARLETALDHLRCAELILREIEPVTMAVEWHDSGDTREDDVEFAVAMWDAERKK